MATNDDTRAPIDAQIEALITELTAGLTRLEALHDQATFVFEDLERRRNALARRLAEVKASVCPPIRLKP
jgi:hypothetical protein